MLIWKMSGKYKCLYQKADGFLIVSSTSVSSQATQLSKAEKCDHFKYNVINILISLPNELINPRVSHRVHLDWFAYITS